MKVGDRGDGSYDEAYLAVFLLGRADKLFRVTPEGGRALVWEFPKDQGDKVKTLLARASAAIAKGDVTI